jgi:hypothetical protein
MKCKACDYPLWNLPGNRRACPECNTPFRPSQYEFTPQAVRFHCPHCEQHYYGTDAHGHLVPRRFECVGCGNTIDMDEMTVTPEEGVSEEAAMPAAAPWFDNERRGFFSRFFGTIWWVHFKPGQFARGTPRSSGAASAWGFALLANLLYSTIMWVGFFVGVAILMAATWNAPGGPGTTPGGGGGGAPPAAAVWGIGVGTGILSALTPAFVMLMLGLWTLGTHAALILTGPREGSLRHTSMAIAFGSATNLLGVIPFCGLYFMFGTWIWSGIAAVFMIIRWHAVGTVRATLCVFAPVLLLLGLGGGSAVAFGLYQASVGQSTIQAQRTSRANSSTQAMSTALLLWAGKNGDVGPAHPLRLLTDGAARPTEFVTSGGSGERPRYGGLSFRRLKDAPASVQETILAKAEAAAPPSQPAVRVGDFVFAYRGLTLGPTTTTPTLWAFICWPEGMKITTRPDGTAVSSITVPSIGTGASVAGPEFVNIGLADGSTDVIELADFAQALAAENAARAAAGLAPIPDPAGVLP